MSHRSARIVVRGLLAVVAVSLPLLAAPALADDPATWPKAPPVTALDWLLVLLIIPGGLSILITLVVTLSTRNDHYEAGNAWRYDDQWFGGPGAGVGDAQTSTTDGTTGGAGGDF